MIDEQTSPAISPSIRVATHADCPALSKLMEELGYHMPADKLPAMVDRIAANGGTVLVAECDQRVIGCVQALVDVRLAAGICGELVSLAVLEELRSRGIGSLLVRAAVDWLREQGCDRVQLRANTIREDAHRFYRREGFVPVKDQRLFVYTRMPSRSE